MGTIIVVKCKNCGTERFVDAVAIDMGYYIAMCSKCDEFKTI